MPQMSPLAWYPLMITFIACLLLFSIMTFWSCSSSSPHTPTPTTTTNITWKW